MHEAPNMIAGARAVLTDYADGAEIMSRNAARAALGRDGKRVDLCTIHRLMTRGKIGVDGQRHLLESAISPGGRTTSAPAIARFRARLNGVNPNTPSGKQINDQHRQAERRLAAACAGIMPLISRMPIQEPPDPAPVRHYAGERLRVLGFQVTALLADNLFMAAWVAIQWGLQWLDHRLELYGVHHCLFVTFQWLFGAASLYLVLLLVAEDVVSVTVSTWRRTRSLFAGQHRNDAKHLDPTNKS